MDELLGGAFTPVTRQIGFIEAEAEEAAERFASWQSHLLPPTRFVTQRVDGDLKAILCRLAPLTSVQRQRFLFVPTTSVWSAYFDNGHQGADVFAAASFLSSDLGCHGVRAVAVPEDEANGGAVIFELYGPEERDFLNFQRTVGTSKEGGRWEFWETGEPLAFELTDQYTAAKVRDRFTVDLLDGYLRALGGIRMFDPDFYAPERYALLVERKGWKALGVEKFPLDDCMDSNT